MIQGASLLRDLHFNASLILTNLHFNARILHMPELQKIQCDEMVMSSGEHYSIWFTGKADG